MATTNNASLADTLDTAHDGRFHDFKVECTRKHGAADTYTVRCARDDKFRAQVIKAIRTAVRRCRSQFGSFQIDCAAMASVIGFAPSTIASCVAVELEVEAA